MRTIYLLIVKHVILYGSREGWINEFFRAVSIHCYIDFKSIKMTKFGSD